MNGSAMVVVMTNGEITCQPVDWQIFTTKVILVKLILWLGALKGE